MKTALVLAAVAEFMTGLALLLVPSLVGWLLFDQELAGLAAVAGRVAGIALISLSIACWPGPPIAGMLLYSAAVAVYLAFIGFEGGSTGAVLWPAVVLHVVITVLLARAAVSRAKGGSPFGHF
jgi:hypothetical protein